MKASGPPNLSRLPDSAFRSLLDQAPYPVALHDAEGVVLFANQALLELMQADQLDDLVGHRIYEFVSENRKPAMEARFQQLLETGEPMVKRPGQAVTCQGNVREVETSASLHTFADQTVVHLLIRDTTEEVEAQRKLEDMNQRFELATLASGAAIWDMDVRSNRMTADAKMHALFELPADSDTSDPFLWNASVHPDDRAAVQTTIAKLFKGEDTYSHRFRLVCAGNRVKHIRAFGRAVKDHQGKVLRIVGINIDSTKEQERLDRRSVQATLLARSQEMGQMGHVVVDVESGKVELSPMLVEIGGLPQQDSYTAEDWYQLLHPDERERMTAALNAAMEPDAKPFEEVYRIITRDTDEIRWVHGRGHVERVSEHEPPRFFGVVKDITELMAKERELRSLADRLQIAIDGAQLGTWEWNANVDVAVFSEHYASMLGYDLTEIPGRLSGWSDLVHPADRGPALEAIEAFRTRKLPRYEIEFRMKRKDGRWAWILSRGVGKDPNAKGVYQSMVGTHLDISNLKEAEAQLVSLTERLQISIEGGDLGIWDWDIPSDAVSHNAQVAAFLGIEYNQLPTTRTDWSALSHPDDVEEASTQFLRGMEENGIGEASYRIRYQEGPWRWFFTRGKVIARAPDGTPLRMAGTHQDITDRRLAELELADVHERLKMAIEGGELGTWDLDVATDQVVVNDQVGRFIGLRPAEFPATLSGWDAFVHPEDLPGVKRLLKQAIRGQHATLFSQFRMRHQDGSWRWWESRGRVMRWNSNGIAERIVGTHRDITDARLAAAEIQEARDRLQLVIEGTEMAIWELDFRTGKGITNAQADQMLGYEKGVYTDQFAEWAELQHPDDIGMANERFAQHLRGDSPIFEVEQRLKKADGNWLWVLTKGRVMERDAAGNPVRAVGFNLDIDARKRAEQELRVLSERLQLTVASSELGTWDWNVETNEIVVNERYATMLGRTVDEIQTPSSRNDRFIHPEDKARCHQALQDHMDGSTQSYECQMRLRHADGHYVTVLDRGRAIDRNAEGRVRRVVGTHLDITARVAAEDERLNMERRLVELQKAESLTILAGGIAHDFNNILMGVMGNAELARAELSEDSPTVTLLDDITEAAERAAELAQQMLDYSGHGRLVVQALQINDLLRDLRAMLGASVPKSTAILYELATNLPLIMGDATQLRQLFMNLVINAAEAIGEGSGTITLRTRLARVESNAIPLKHDSGFLAEGAYVVVSVADTGQGISPETMIRLFDPFFSTKFTGRGLGLAATLGIMKGHHGTIQVESEVGQGAEFHAYFPATDAAQLEHLAAQDDVMEKTFEGPILVVDDELAVRTVASRVLTKLGFTVHLACDGYEAMEVYRVHGETIRCVILDMTMPKMDGRETLHHLRELNPSVKVLISSGFNEHEVVDRFGKVSPTAFIQKPFRIQSLTDKLNEILNA